MTSRTHPNLERLAAWLVPSPALVDARWLEAPPETHALLEEWRTVLGA